MHATRMTSPFVALLWLLLVWAVLLVGPVQAVDLLEPEDAFKVSATAIAEDRIEARFQIADNYYLYQDRIEFTSLTAGITLGEAVLPPGEEKNDQFFGDVVIYKNDFTAEIPVRNGAGKTLELRVRMQGCAEAGVCYPPQSETISVSLPGTPASASGTTALSDLVRSIDIAGLADSAEPLDPEIAFQSDAILDGDTVYLRWDIAPGHYMYRDRVQVGLIADGASIGKASIDEGKLKDDPNFGEMWVFYDRMDATIPISRSPENTSATLIVSYQGCADMGLCYPPMEDVWHIDFVTGKIGKASQMPAVMPTLMTIAETGNLADDATLPTTTTATALDAPLQSEQDAIAERLASGNLWLVMFWFFVIGLALSLTPCVFPMIPILAGIIVGQGEHVTTRRAFIMSLVYVLAMALTYTTVGVLAGLFGSNLQATFQNPWILSGFALIFVLLALSMFGFYELQLPSSLQSKIMEVQNRQKGGTLTGVAVMGFLSALIVGPCMAPPLAGALIYIGQTGDALLGGGALFAMSLGMGTLLIAVGTLGGQFLPRAGNWMNAVKAVFGVLLLGVAIWMLERIVPNSISLLLWALLAIGAAIYMGALEPIREGASGWSRLWKALGVVLLIWGALIMVGIAAGGKGSPLAPLAGLSLGSSAGGQAQAQLQFQHIENEAELEAMVEQAAANGQAVMLDFYADWCVSCKEMESFTFSDPGVIAALDNVMLLKADVTRNNDDDKALLRRFNLFGPPGIIFFDQNGNELSHMRVVGYMPAERFRAHVETALGK